MKMRNLLNLFRGADKKRLGAFEVVDFGESTKFIRSLSLRIIAS